MTQKTNRKSQARALATAEGISYQTALARVSSSSPNEDIISLPAIFPESLTAGLYISTGPTGSGQSLALSELLRLIGASTMVSLEDVGVDTISPSTAPVFYGEVGTFEDLSNCLDLADRGLRVVATLHASRVTHALAHLLASIPEQDLTATRKRLGRHLNIVLSQISLPLATKDGIVVARETLVMTDKLRSTLADTGPFVNLMAEVEAELFAGRTVLEWSLARLVHSGRVTAEYASIWVSVRSEFEMALQTLAAEEGEELGSPITQEQLQTIIDDPRTYGIEARNRAIERWRAQSAPK